MASGVTSTTYTTSVTLTKGRTYAFKVQSRNSVGLSDFSSPPISILAAQIPAQPVAPTTTVSGANVVIVWSAPDNGGSALTAYQIKVRQSDLATYTLVTCTESTATMLSSSLCTVAIATLKASPFSLAWGSSIYASVAALNTYGTSPASTGGNGAVILTVPDAPLSLANNPLITSGSQVGLSWAQGLSNGGAAVIDFTISMKESAGSYSVLASAITSQTYIVVGLTMGSSYTFKVLARNPYGSSLYSAEIVVLAAQTPS